MSDDKFDYDETGRRPKPTCVCAETSARNCPVHSEPKPAADGAREWWIEDRECNRQERAEAHAKIAQEMADGCAKREIENLEALVKAEARIAELQQTPLAEKLLAVQRELAAAERERDDLRAKLAACEEALKPK